MPIRPTKPETNSHTAAGMGTPTTVSGPVPNENATSQMTEALVTPVMPRMKVPVCLRKVLKLLLPMPSGQVGLQYPALVGPMIRVLLLPTSPVRR